VTLRCPVCRDVQGRPVAPYRHTSNLFAGLTRTVCDECGMAFASPMPADAALAAYNASYFESAHGGGPINPVLIAFHSAINLLRVAYVDRYVDANGVRVQSVLEVGPGGGHFAKHWLARHPGTSYLAIEADQSLHAALRGQGIQLFERPEDLSEEPLLDLVVMSHVLEHTADPSAFLLAMTARLRSGGVLFVEVPCRDWEHKPQDEPHLLFFDKAPMARLLGDLEFGKIQLSYHGREIGDLQSRSWVTRVGGAIRSRLLGRGVVAPFARTVRGLESLEDPLERAAVAPYQAHIEQSKPAWWLRAAALKLSDIGPVSGKTIL